MVGTNYKPVAFLFGTVYLILCTVYLINYSVLLCEGSIIRRMSLSVINFWLDQIYICVEERKG